MGHARPRPQLSALGRSDNRAQLRGSFQAGTNRHTDQERAQEGVPSARGVNDLLREGGKAGQGALRRARRRLVLLITGCTLHHPPSPGLRLDAPGRQTPSHPGVVDALRHRRPPCVKVLGSHVRIQGRAMIVQACALAASRPCHPMLGALAVVAHAPCRERNLSCFFLPVNQSLSPIRNISPSSSHLTSDPFSAVQAASSEPSMPFLRASASPQSFCMSRSRSAPLPIGSPLPSCRWNATNPLGPSVVTSQRAEVSLPNMHSRAEPSESSWVHVLGWGWGLLGAGSAVHAKRRLQESHEGLCRWCPEAVDNGLTIPCICCPCRPSLLKIVATLVSTAAPASPLQCDAHLGEGGVGVHILSALQQDIKPRPWLFRLHQDRNAC